MANTSYNHYGANYGRYAPLPFAPMVSILQARLWALGTYGLDCPVAGSTIISRISAGFAMFVFMAPYAMFYLPNDFDDICRVPQKDIEPSFIRL